MRFKQGEKVLCFGPDHKLVHEAKIIDVRKGKDDFGKRRFDYLVHFLNWKRSYDRY